MTEKAFIELGSNIEPEKYLPLAVRELTHLGEIRSVSNAYQNPAIAAEPQPDYLNAAVLLETRIPPLELRTHLRLIEEKLGRVRTEDKFAARTIDLDIALYGEMILEHPLLRIPDDQIYHRPHLAVTLAECDPDFSHPKTGESLITIAERLKGDASLTLRDDLGLANGLSDSQEKSAV